MGKSYVLSIGVNKYQDSRIRDLLWACNDARSFHQTVLLGRDSSSVEAKILLNEEASLRSIKQALGGWLANADSEDNIIVFFAGHGCREVRPGGNIRADTEAYLLPADADINEIYASSISLTNDVPNVIQRMAAEHITFILDCCLSGSAQTWPDARPRGFDGPNFKAMQAISEVALNASVLIPGGAEQNIGSGRSILMACSSNQAALERDLLRHGVFTYHLIQVLERERKRGEASISLGDLYAQIVGRVVTDTNAGQVPMLDGRLADQQIFLGV